MQAFKILQPPASHFRPARCEEVECPNHEKGWVTVLDQNNPQHAGLFTALRDSGRRFERMRSEEAAERTGKALPPGLTAFVFGAGQQCFERHLVPVGRDPIFMHERNGVRRRHANGLNFNEQFNEEAYRVSRRTGA